MTGLFRNTGFLALFVLGLALPACALWQAGEIDLGEAPGALVMDPVTRDLFATTGTSTLLRIEEATHEVNAILLQGAATSLAVDPAGRLLFAAQPAAGTVTVIGIDSGDTSIVATGGSPGATAVDPLRGLACVCDPAGDRIVVIQSGSVARTFTCNGTPEAVAVDPLTGRGFAALADGGLVFEFDAAGTDTSYHAAGAGPAVIEIDPERGEVYVGNSEGASITVLHIDSGTTSTVTLTENPVAMALNTDTGKLYSAGGNALEIVTTATHAALKVVLPGQPQSVAVDALSDRAFAAMPTAGLVAEVTSAGDTVLIDVGGTPSACIFNPVTNKCYVSDGPGLCVRILEAADYTGTTVAASGGPGPVEISPRSHKVYTPRYYAAKTTVIDGYTGVASEFAVADGPNGVLIDPVTDDVYIVCAWSASVAVKRAGSPDTLLAPVHQYPHGIGINPNTGKVYVSNRGSEDLSVIDAATLDTALVRTGNYPCFVGVNPEDNRIYTTNRTTWSLTVVDGATLTTEFAPVGPGPTQVRVNPATNKMLVADSNDRTVSVIDGGTLERTVVPAGSTPRAVAVNTLTNTFYASSGLDGEITVIDGDTYERTPVKGDVGLFDMHVDPYLNKVYSVSWDRNTVTVVDGVSLASLIVPVGDEPHSSAYDPVLEKLYVSNHAGNSISIMTLREKVPPRLEVAVDSLAGHVTYSSTPTITGTATSLRSPRNFGIMKVLYKIDCLRGEWSEATITGSGGSVGWQLTTPPLLLGEHTIFVTAIDSTAGSISSSSSSGLLRMSDFAAYTFTRLTPPPAAPGRIVVERADGEGRLCVTWENTCGDGGWYDIEISSDPTFTEGVRRLTGITRTSHLLAPGAAPGENEYVRVIAVDYPHAKRGVPEEGVILRPSGTAGDGGPPRTALELFVYPNPSPGDVNLRLVGAEHAPVTCSIYDVTGHLIADLPVLGAGDEAAATWENASAGGPRVAPGIYYARVETPAGTVTRKIILIR